MLRQLISYPKTIFRFIRPSMCISKRIMWIISKSHFEIIFFCIFLQSTYQVDMKNVVDYQREFFAYFNAVETRGEFLQQFHFRMVILFESSFGNAKLQYILSSIINCKDYRNPMKPFFKRYLKLLGQLCRSVE